MNRLIKRVFDMSSGAKNVVLGILYIIGMAVLWVLDLSPAAGCVLGAVWLAVWILFIFCSGRKYAVGTIIWWALAFAFYEMAMYVYNTESFALFMQAVLCGPALAFTSGAYPSKLYGVVSGVMIAAGLARIIMLTAKKKKDKQ